MEKKNRKSFYNEMLKEIQKKEELKAKEQIKSATKKNKAADEAFYIKKGNPLKLYRQYNTYQALLDVYPQGDLTVEQTFCKVILYVMKWYRERIMQSEGELRPEIKEAAEELKKLFPEPEEHKSFNTKEAVSVNPYSFSDVKAVYDAEKKLFKLRLNEPDNGAEKTGVIGRSFTTEVCVYPGEKAVVIGTRVSCREPEENTEDAAAFRPAFIRAMFIDDELLLTEAGIDKDYAFGNEAVVLNGKSEKDCKRIVEQLVSSDRRNMPVIFVPGSLYEEELKEEIDKKTISLLGFCHVIVWKDSAGKLFGKCMDSQELAEVADEGQIIYYRKPGFVSLYENVTKEVINSINLVGHREPIRKEFNFGDCDFEFYTLFDSGNENLAEENNRLSEELQQVRNRLSETRKDAENLQLKLAAVEEENKRLDKANSEASRHEARASLELDNIKGKNCELKSQIDDLKRNNLMLETMLNAGVDAEKKKYEPLINLPPFDLRSKEDIMGWIEKYYSDVLILHSTAKDSFYKDQRNVDFRSFCMMIHYLAGFTRSMNEGAAFEKANEMARGYDVENSGYKVEPASTGSAGATVVHRDKYTINIFEYTGDAKDAKTIMDMHIGRGKGRGDDMIRIYGCYCSKIKKFVIGKMLEHLPTNKDAH